MRETLILARRWGHYGEDEAAVKTGTSESDADDDDGSLFIPAQHFHRQKSSNAVQ